MKKVFCKLVVVTLVIGIFFLTMLLNGCNKDEGTSILLTISAEPAYSVQLGEKPGEFDVSSYMIVSEEGSNVEWQLELKEIEGFTYEKGYEYLLRVKKTADSNLTRYSLKAVVSKTKKDDTGTIVLLHVSTDIKNLPGTDIPVFSDPPLVLVREDGVEWWHYLFIFEGFVYENGFDYLLKVHKTTINMPVVSGIPSFYIYSLIEIISKTPNQN